MMETTKKKESPIRGPKGTETQEREQRKEWEQGLVCVYPHAHITCPR